MCTFSLGTLTLLKTSFGYKERLSSVSLSPHERNQSLQWDIGKLPTQTQEEEAPGGLCQHCLQHGYFFTTQTRIACRVWGGGWTPRSKSNHISQFFQSAKKLYKHREASPFLNSGKRLPRMFYNAQFSFLFYFFLIQTVSQACQECF